MRKMADRRNRSAKTTIIRRQIKKNHAGHHGGAWKVAFADFTLAMMALFMTLWIVNSVSKSDREEIVAALHGQSIFNGGGMAPLNSLSSVPRRGSKEQSKDTLHNMQDKTSRPQKMAQVTEENAKKASDVNQKMVIMKQKSVRELGELATDINVIARNAHMETNLEMEIVPQGLRVLVKDDQNRSMFERGSAKIMPFFKSLLVELTPVFDSLDNKLIITGHTDAISYKSNIYNNWNLSGDRALSARRVMEDAGMPSDKVMQVSAMADQMLLDNKNPESAGNRRIEIMVLTQSASDTLHQYFGQHGEKIVQPLIEKLDMHASAISQPKR
ncbi:MULTISPECIES: putative lateral flagellar export/assembly protein LafU [Enterobacterales]|uniref:putative lateral flagellar export/assembly protein LafU n=1 Tax=Enterobacterales TaxID=91347 RepID=UPI002ED83DCC